VHYFFILILTFRLLLIIQQFNSLCYSRIFPYKFPSICFCIILLQVSKNCWFRNRCFFRSSTYTNIFIQ